MIRLIGLIVLALVSAAQAQNTETFQNYMSSRASATSITGLQQFLVLQNNQVRLGSLAQIGAGVIVSNITRAQIATSTIGGNIVVTNGFSAPGDAGAGCIYSTVGATVGGLMNINDASGNHWNLVPNHGQADGLGGGSGGELPVGCFGAAQDQTTDDTAAVQRGVNWAIGNQGTLYLANSKITSGIVFTAVGSTSYLFFNLVGVGQGPSLIAANPNFTMLTLDAGAAGSFDTFTLRNLSFYNTGAINGTGITFASTANPSGIQHFLLDNLLFSNLTTGIIVTASQGMDWATWSKIRFFNCTNGINFVHASGTGITFNDIVLQLASTTTGTGVHMGDGSSNMGDMTWNNIQGNTGNIGFDLQGGAYGDYNEINGFHWDSPNLYGIQIRNLVHTVLNGNWTNAPYNIDLSNVDTQINLHQQENEANQITTVNNFTINGATRWANFSQTTTPIGISGVATPFDGRLLVISNVSGQNITILHENSGSTTTNRFNLGGANATLASGQSINLRWAGTVGRWIRVGTQ